MSKLSEIKYTDTSHDRKIKAPTPQDMKNTLKSIIALHRQFMTSEKNDLKLNAYVLCLSSKSHCHGYKKHSNNPQGNDTGVG